jgi:YD repeat-containing protein
LHVYNGKIQERIFHVYDENGQLQLTIKDDGSGQQESDWTDVTFRRITAIQPEINPAISSFGKPQQILEAYQTNGQITPLKRTELFYDASGNEIKRRIYNSQNTFCYETTKIYDDRQRLIQETNPLGHITSYAYDENNNKIEKIFMETSSPKKRIHTIVKEIKFKKQSGRQTINKLFIVATMIRTAI